MSDTWFLYAKGYVTVQISQYQKSYLVTAPTCVVSIPRSADNENDISPSTTFIWPSIIDEPSSINMYVWKCHLTEAKMPTKHQKGSQRDPSDDFRKPVHEIVTKRCQYCSSLFYILASIWRRLSLILDYFCSRFLALDILIFAGQSIFKHPRKL